MEKAPLNDPLFRSVPLSRIDSSSWVQWLTALSSVSGVFPHASSHSANGADAITISQSQVTGLANAFSNKANAIHATTHGANGADALTLAQSQVSNLTGDLSNLSNSLGNKADKILTVTAGNGLIGGGNLSANFSISANVGNAANTLAAGDDARFANFANHIANTSIHLPGTILAVTVLTGGTGTFTPNANSTWLWVRMVGGAGGGGGSTANANQSATATGGSSGAYCEKFIANIEANYIWTSGVGGNGGANGSANGANGTASTFIGAVLGTLTANGGLGGIRGASTTPPGINEPTDTGSTATGGDINVDGTPGTTGFLLSLTSTISGRGAASMLSGFTRSARGTEAGQAGKFPGGGGGGAASQNGGGNRAGGNGANGAVIVFEGK
jgi:hypothetical protein